MTDNSTEKKKAPLGEEKLEHVSGGSCYDYCHDLSQFVQRTVCRVVMYDTTRCLTLHRAPNGPVIPGFGWQNGDPILVHGQYKEDGWYFAYNGGVYDYVNPNTVM